MSRPLWRAGAIVMLTVMGGVLAPACAVNESSFFVRGCLLEPPDTCMVTPDTSTAQRESGFFDAAQGFDYQCPLLIGNQLVARGDPNKLRTETSRIQVESADVQVFATDPSTGEAVPLPAFSVPASGFVDPGSQSAPGYGIARVTLLDAFTASQHVGETLVSHVIVRGRTLGGNEIATGEWTFPIVVNPPLSLCDLTGCIPGATSMEKPTKNCHPGADDFTDCRLGCNCTVGAGQCAPLGCVAPKGTTAGICQACTVGNTSDCTKPLKCTPFPSKTSPTGLCK